MDPPCSCPAQPQRQNGRNRSAPANWLYQVDTRLANMPRCLIGMEACVGAHHLSLGNAKGARP